MSFNNVFGGSVLEPADVAYRAVSLTADVTFVWPPYSVSATDYVAQIMEVTPSADGFSITMPPANQVSTGQDVLFTNPSAFSYTVKDNAGSTIVTVSAGQQVFIYVTDNTSLAGVWNSFLFGAGSSSLSAAAVQGYGVTAIGSTLNQSHPITTFVSNKSIVASDRSSVQVWTSGAGTLTLPLAATIGNNFFFEVRNQGTGVLTIAPQVSDLIDSLVNIQLQPNDSCFVHCAGSTSWYTVGRGRNTQFNFTLLTKTVTGGTDTLTLSEAANVVQEYVGLLTSNETVVLPATVQIYYITNSTTGPYTLTFQSPTPGGTVTVPTNNNVILFCDGVNVAQANNSITTSVASLVLQPGTAALPSLTFTGSNSSGLYAPTAGTVGVSINGNPSLTFSGLGAVNIPNVNITGGSISGVTLPSAPVPDFLLYAQGII